MSLAASGLGRGARAMGAAAPAHLRLLPPRPLAPRRPACRSALLLPASSAGARPHGRHLFHFRNGIGGRVGRAVCCCTRCTSRRRYESYCCRRTISASDFHDPMADCPFIRFSFSLSCARKQQQRRAELDARSQRQARCLIAAIDAHPDAQENSGTRSRVRARLPVLPALPRQEHVWVREHLLHRNCPAWSALFLRSSRAGRPASRRRARACPRPRAGSLPLLRTRRNNTAEEFQQRFEAALGQSYECPDPTSARLLCERRRGLDRELLLAVQLSRGANHSPCTMQ